MSPNPSLENEIAVADMSESTRREETQHERDTEIIYPLTSCAFQPAFGKIYTLFSSKFVFLASLLTFEIGSVVCATSQISHVFILGRALAGLGSAGIQAGTTLILAECVPLRQRPTWNSIIGSIFAVGSVAGPLLGGAFSNSTTWRWCFYINLPIGGAVMIFIALFYDGSRGRKNTSNSTGFSSQVARFDLAGTFTFMSATISLLLELSWGGTTYAWGSARIVALLTLTGVLFCSFFGIEYWMKDSAIIPLCLLYRRSIIAAIWFGLCLGGVFFVNDFYIPIWFQIVDCVSVIKSSILFIPFMIIVVGGFMFAGFGTAATGYYTPFVYAGSILMSIGEEQGLYMVQTTLPEIDVATGIGIILFAQTFGGALFVSQGAENAGSEPGSSLCSGRRKDGGMAALPGDSSTQTSTELQAVYGVAIKEALRVGLLLATISSVGALMYDWKSLKTRKNDGSGQRNSDNDLDHVAGV
ncbi:hypothetical protein BCON_0310g00050 [Botryotinia convoluta]|uniref:Major facilitator superfamily (MFS) profile domain-containing protein n=1 Tax=Botryotinia convoluta TaxID=54673 RepID=A0A4Z1HP84_9HELO|nr:hypothetical protein BCON_0310g00050 [Botryotinia convoluta]